MSIHEKLKNCMYCFALSWQVGRIPDEVFFGIMIEMKWRKSLASRCHASLQLRASANGVSIPELKLSTNLNCI